MHDESHARPQDLRCLAPAVVPMPHRRLHGAHCGVLILATPISPTCGLTPELSGSVPSAANEGLDGLLHVVWRNDRYFLPHATLFVRSDNFKRSRADTHTNN